MTSVARLLLSEADATVLFGALDGDERLADLPTSFGETKDSRWLCLVYLSEGNETVETAALRRLCTKIFGEPAPEYKLERVPDVDWVTKSLKNLTPVRVGRFLIHGGHDRAVRRPNDIAIEIEAGQAFGTGHHATTVACLSEIDRVARSRKIVNALDVGTGSGVLAIAIAKAAKAPVLASEIDSVAAGVARENIRLNGVSSSVTTAVAGSLTRQAFRARAPYDLILANILAAPLIALAPQIARLVGSGGTVVLSGLLPNQRARVVTAYRQQGLALCRTLVVDDWLALVCIKPKRPGNRRPEPVARVTSDIRRRSQPRLTHGLFRRSPTWRRRATEYSR